MDATCNHPDGCDRPPKTRGMCHMHYQRVRNVELKTGTGAPPVKYGPLTIRRCKIDGCPKKSVAHNYCNMHYMRYRRHGDPLVRLRDVKGGTFVDPMVRVVFPITNPAKTTLTEAAYYASGALAYRLAAQGRRMVHGATPRYVFAQRVPPANSEWSLVVSVETEILPAREYRKLR